MRYRNLAAEVAAADAADYNNAPPEVQAHRAERLKDARALQLLFGVKKIHYAGSDPYKQFPLYIPSGKPWRTHQIDARPVPLYGRDPAAARALLEAVPEGKRRDVVVALRARIFDAHGPWSHYADEMFAVLLAPPAAIRDAVVEVMGEGK